MTYVAREPGVWPTQEMTVAGCRVALDTHESHVELVDEVFLAMTEAAPKIEEPQWITDLRKELMLSKATMQLLGGRFPVARRTLYQLQQVNGAWLDVSKSEFDSIAHNYGRIVYSY
jgi:uncharacterized membrane protein YjdF